MTRQYRNAMHDARFCNTMFLQALNRWEAIRPECRSTNPDTDPYWRAVVEWARDADAATANAIGFASR
jgi:hypothetical protein